MKNRELENAPQHERDRDKQTDRQTERERARAREETTRKEEEEPRTQSAFVCPAVHPLVQFPGGHCSLSIGRLPGGPSFVRPTHPPTWKNVPLRTPRNNQFCLFRISI